MQTQYENNGAVSFLLGFEGGASTLTLLLTPACSRNGGCKGGGEMPTLDCAVTIGLAVLFADEESFAPADAFLEENCVTVVHKQGDICRHLYVRVG